MKKRLFLRYGALVAAIAVSGGLLLHTSQSVQRAESQMHDLKTSIERERQTIDVLQAEWAYLNAPYRLEKLAQQYLGMVPSEASFIVPDLGILQDESEAAGIENAVLAGSQDKPAAAKAAQQGLQHVSAAPVKKAAPPPAASVEKSVNGSAETGFDDLMNRLGRGQ